MKKIRKCPALQPCKQSDDPSQRAENCEAAHFCRAKAPKHFVRAGAGALLSLFGWAQVVSVGTKVVSVGAKVVSVGAKVVRWA